jgi:hypothetical protein
LNPNRPPDSSRKFLNKLLIADSGAVSGLSVEANVHAPGGALEVVCFFLEVALVLDRPD